MVAQQWHKGHLFGLFSQTEAVLEGGNQVNALVTGGPTTKTTELYAKTYNSWFTHINIYKYIYG